MFDQDQVSDQDQCQARIRCQAKMQCHTRIMPSDAVASQCEVYMALPKKLGFNASFSD